MGYMPCTVKIYTKKESGEGRTAKRKGKKNVKRETSTCG
jgi:hypothetical protein